MPHRVLLERRFHVGDHKQKNREHVDELGLEKARSKVLSHVAWPDSFGTASGISVYPDSELVSGSAENKRQRQFAHPARRRAADKAVVQHV